MMIMDEFVLALVFLFGDVNGAGYVGGDYEVTFLKVHEGFNRLIRFVRLCLGS